MIEYFGLYPLAAFASPFFFFFFFLFCFVCVSFLVVMFFFFWWGFLCFVVLVEINFFEGRGVYCWRNQYTKMMQNIFVSHKLFFKKNFSLNKTKQNKIFKTQIKNKNKKKNKTKLRKTNLNFSAKEQLNQEFSFLSQQIYIFFQSQYI